VEARTFSAEDQPDRLAELIAGFAREPTGTAGLEVQQLAHE